MASSMLVAGSTHADEELWVHEAVCATGERVRQVLVPRHPERASAVCEQLAAHGVRTVRWSACAGSLPALRRRAS